MPLTSNLRWARAPGNDLLSAAATSLPKDSVANVSLIVALDRGQLIERVGKLSRRQLELILSGIDVIVGRRAQYACTSRGRPMLDFPIFGSGPLSSQVRALGFESFKPLAAHVCTLPYGRVPAAEDVLAVLRQGRGTCSSKHRLLATLAHECGHAEMQLTLGLYEMSERNTPGVGHVLAAAQLDAIPEAHCYLTWRGRRYDFTGVAAGASSPFDSLIEECTVDPKELPAVKQRFHREALEQWALARNIDPEHAWSVREQCIAELEKISATRSAS